MAYNKENEYKQSEFNTAAHDMFRIATTKAMSNEFQFKNDYNNWAKTIMILFKECSSKLTKKEDVAAEKLLSEMNEAINSFRSVSGIRMNESEVYRKCHIANKYVLLLHEKHNLGSHNKEDPGMAALGDE